MLRLEASFYRDAESDTAKARLSDNQVLTVHNVHADLNAASEQ